MAGNAAEVQYLPMPMETAPQGSDVRKVRGDGNCFFRCLSVNITGTESNQKALRKAIVGMKHYEENLLEDYLDWRNPTYGEGHGLGPCRNLDRGRLPGYRHLHRNPWSKQQDGTDQVSCKLHWDDQQPEYNAIYLDHSSGDHYNCVKSACSQRSPRPPNWI